MAYLYYLDVDMDDKVLEKASVNWFPGHMTKAKRTMETVLPSCDMVIELRDARAPFSCANPLIQQLTQNKIKLIILTKSDLADPACLKRCMELLSDETTKVISSSSLVKFNKKEIVNASLELMKPKHDKQKAKGIRPRATRAMVCGIPNVGKSTFINHMKGKRTLVAENRPGVTQSITWLSVDSQLDLCDTPGMLWPKFDNQKIAIHLALINAIKQSIIDPYELASEGMRIFMRYYPQGLMDRYPNFDSNHPFESIAKANGCDINKAYQVFINDLNNHRLGKVSYEGHLCE